MIDENSPKETHVGKFVCGEEVDAPAGGGTFKCGRFEQHPIHGAHTDMRVQGHVFMPRRIEAYHALAVCEAGLCAHATSINNPCRCPTCDPELAKHLHLSQVEHVKKSTIAQSQISEQFASQTFSTFKVDDGRRNGYEAALEVAANTKRGVGLYGDAGLGKSHLAAAIVNEAMHNGIVAGYVYVNDMLLKIQETFDKVISINGREDLSQNALLRTYASMPVLVLDDFSKPALSGWNVRTLDVLINRRLENGLPIIITSNLSPLKLAKRKVNADADQVTHDTMIDRLKDMVFEWIEMTGESWRGRHR